jgi:N6-adenosine-specific RNA methylase IME4
VFENKVEAASKRAYDGMTRRFVKAAEIERAKERHAKVIEHGCAVDDLVALADSGYRASVIYADPPWPWQTWGGPSGKIRSAPDNHYGTSPLDEIMKLPVAALAAEDCALLLWCTGPHIAIGTHIKIIEAWGFKPSTIAFDWVKTNADGEGLHTGMGYWTRSNAEACFIATKGSLLRLATDVHQVVLAPLGDHSAKPEGAAPCDQSLVAAVRAAMRRRQRVASNKQTGIMKMQYDNKNRGALFSNKERKETDRDPATPARWLGTAPLTDSASIGPMRDATASKSLHHLRGGRVSGPRHDRRAKHRRCLVVQPSKGRRRAFARRRAASPWRT